MVGCGASEGDWEEDGGFRRWGALEEPLQPLLHPETPYVDSLEGWLDVHLAWQSSHRQNSQPGPKGKLKVNACTIASLLGV